MQATPATFISLETVMSNNGGNGSRAPQLSARRFKAKSISTRYSLVIQLHMLGWKNVDIASELDMSSRSVADVLDSPIVQERLEIMKASMYQGTMDVRKRIDAMLPKAVQVYEEILNGKINDQKVSPALLHEVAKEVIVAKVDEMNPKSRKQVDINVFNKSDLDDIKKLAYEKDKQDALEAHYEEVPEGDEDAETA